MGRRKLSKEEMETIFLTSEADETWEIYTFNEEIKEKLRNFSREYPRLCFLKSEDKTLGYETYVIHKSRVSIRFMAPYKDSIKKAKSEHAKKYGISTRLNE